MEIIEENLIILLPMAAIRVFIAHDVNTKGLHSIPAAVFTLHLFTVFFALHCMRHICRSHLLCIFINIYKNTQII
jgi:hypothetical protein